MIDDKISFGEYDWHFLDKQENTALLITKKIIEIRQYHHADTEMTWDKSDLRKYLNGEFYDKFDDEDKSRIITATTQNKENQIFGISGGQDTQDKIFILGLEEYISYFCDEISARMFADKDCNGLCEIKYYPVRRKAKYDGKFSAIWLRSPGCYSSHAVYVNAAGCIKAVGDRFNRFKGIRPALWLKLN
ncbi:MAG: DUF6273 domain-containing protein [Clostridia bacterium]|nr:DUF6273 domain-containing protein [Clostridia bacterium]